MPGDSSEYKIKFTTVADGSGAAQTKQDLEAVASGMGDVVDDTEKAEKAFGKAAESGEKLNETQERAAKILGNLRSAHHAVHGAMDLMKGDLTGLAVEGRVATEIFEGMLGPLAPLLLVITTLTSIAMPMLEKAMEGQEKATEEANKALEEQNQKIDDRVEKGLEVAVKKETDAIKLQIDAEKELDGWYQSNEAHAKTALSDATALIDATTKLTIAKLEAQKIQALESASSDSERHAIEAEYKQKELSVTDHSDEVKYQVEKAVAQREAMGKRDQLSNAQDQLSGLRSQRDAFSSRAQSAAEEASEYGIKPDEQGSFADAWKQALSERVEAMKALNDGQRKGVAPARMNELAQAVAEAIKKARVAFVADYYQKSNETNGKELDGRIAELSKQVGDLQSALDSAQSKIDQLDLGRQGGHQENVNKANEANDAAGKQRFTDWQKDDDKDAEKLKKEEKAQIEQISGLIEASGNKETIAQLRKIVELDKNDLAKELADLLKLHISNATENNKAIKAEVKAIREEIHKNKMSLVNGGGYQ